MKNYTKPTIRLEDVSVEDVLYVSGFVDESQKFDDSDEVL